MQNRPDCAAQAQGGPRCLFGTIPESMALTFMFGAFVFLQFTVLGLANHAGEGYLTTAQRELVYYGLQVFVILGYLLHSLFFRSCTGKRNRNRITCGVLGLFFVCTAYMLAAGTASLLYVVVSMAAVLCLGGIGGAAHLRMSLGTFMGTGTARCMGIGSASAVVLQYLLQIRWGATPLLPVVMLAAFLLYAGILLYRFPEAVIEGGKKPGKATPGRIACAILIAAAFILFACFYNEYIHHLQIRSGYEAYNVYSWPRLMLVPGYLLFAAIGDRKNGKYVPAASLCIMLIAMLNVVLTGVSGAYWLNMCLFYCMIAAFTSYYLLTFWRLAPGTENPALWAPFGRMLDSGMVLLTGAIRLSALPAPVVLGVDIAGIAMVILMMAVNGDFNLTGAGAADPAGMQEKSPAAPETVPAEPGPERIPPVPGPEGAASGLTAPGPERVTPVLGPEETLMRIRETCHLTPRETDVLRELVLTEDKQAVISERLSIRVKTLQDYVTRLYRKTGVSTRAGLTDLYHESRNQV